MIGYVTLGTNDLARSARFYDALLAEIGAKRILESDRFISWSAGAGGPGLGVIKRFGKAATPYAAYFRDPDGNKLNFFHFPS